jgi:hypothetical protein
MEKLSCLLVALFAFGTIAAQETTPGDGFKRGDAFISGSVGFNHIKNRNVESNSFNVSPKVAYFVNNNIALGASLAYYSVNEDVNTYEYGMYEQKRNSFSGGIFARYYVTPSNKFAVFAQLGAAYSTNRYETQEYGSKATINGFDVQLAPAISYFVSNHFALEATLGLLSYSTYKPGNNSVAGEESDNNFNIGLNLSNINFGVVYKF